jgi:hypothetical protein
MLSIDPKRLRVNRSEFTLKLGLAGLPLSEMWTHVLPAERYWRTGEKLPKASAYDEVCKAAAHTGCEHKGGETLFSILYSLHKGHIREPITAFDLGDGEAEIHGGHHRAVAALVAGQDVPVIYRDLDAIAHVRREQLYVAERAYQRVEHAKGLASGRSYNPMPGRRPIRRGTDRLRMIYRAIVDVSGDTLLDAGCNDGYFGVALLSHAFKPTFVEQSAVYCDVVRGKLAALGHGSESVYRTTIALASPRRYDVVLYTDVFYHAATKLSLRSAMRDWSKLLDMTVHRMIFCPGRWDKLAAVGFSERLMMHHARRCGFRIRYLGRDSDEGYRRPLFCLERVG